MRLLLVGVIVAGCRFEFDLLPEGTDPEPPTIVTVGPQVPALGRTWMLGVNPGTDLPCTYDSDFYDGCTHAAEHLVIRVADATTECASLSVSDELEAFDWACRRDGNELVFESLGLRAAAGLATLIDAAGWTPNRFIARAATIDRFVSEPGVWWDNPVVPLPDNSTSGAVVTLADSRTIYTLASSRSTAGYTLGADHIAVVVLDGAVLTPAPGPLNCGASTPDARCLLVSTNVHTGLWIEGELDGRGVAASNYGIWLYAPQWSTLRHVHTHHHAGDGAYVEYADALLVFGYVATHNVGDGFSDYTSYVTARHVVTARNSGAGYAARTFGLHLLVDVRSYNNSIGIEFTADATGMFSDVLTANNEGAGLIWQNAYSGGSLHAVTSINNASVGVNVENLAFGSLNRVASVNNGGDGLRLVTDATSEVAQTVTAHNTLYGIEMINSDDMLFGYNMLFGANALGECLVSGGTNPGLDSGCLRTPPGATTFNVNLSSSFVGGSTTASELTLDWTLPLPHQAWGPDAASVLAARGRCQSGDTCRLWDYSLDVADTMLRDLATPVPLMPGAICPPGVRGDAAISVANEQCFPTYNAPCPRTYLVNALEILDDHVGNDDGYCESSERCIYLRHMSNDPGRGELLDPCVFQDGAVTGVTMYGYAE